MPKAHGKAARISIGAATKTMIAPRTVRPPYWNSPRVMNEIGLTHLSVSVEDIDATAALAELHGGSVLPETHVGAAVMIRDPDGQLLELLPMGYRASLPD